jgi:hypothetical protein
MFSLGTDPERRQKAIPTRIAPPPRARISNFEQPAQSPAISPAPYLNTYTYAVTMPQAQPELKKVSPPRNPKRPEPNLKKYLEKRILVQLNGSRKVMGVLRGYDVRTRLLISVYLY